MVKYHPLLLVELHPQAFVPCGKSMVSRKQKNTSMVGFPHHWFTGGYTNKISVELH